MSIWVVMFVQSIVEEIEEDVELIIVFTFEMVLINYYK